jgi:hypothetical protein
VAESSAQEADKVMRRWLQRLGDMAKGILGDGGDVEGDGNISDSDISITT